MSQTKFFDAHDLESGIDNRDHMTEEDFVRAFAAFDEVADEEYVTEMRAGDEVDFPFESFTGAKTVTGRERAATVDG